ncbi:DMT family transporter [Anaerolineales bacterium]
MSNKNLLIFFVQAAIWGSSYIFINIASPLIGPVFLMFSRVTIASVVLLLYAYFTGQLPDMRRFWKIALISGFLNAALPFTLIGFAQLSLTASLGSIMNATTPLWTAVIASLWLGIPLTRNKLIGVVLGIFGVFILVGWSPITVDESLLLAIALSLAAALSYGFGTNYIKQHAEKVNSLHMSIGQFVGASVILIGPGLLQQPSGELAMEALLALVILSVLCTSVAYLMFFHIIYEVGPTIAASVSFLIPLFATFYGALLLQEPLSVSLIVGLLVILISVALVMDINPIHMILHKQTHKLAESTE